MSYITNTSAYPIVIGTGQYQQTIPPGERVQTTFTGRVINGSGHDTLTVTYSYRGMREDLLTPMQKAIVRKHARPKPDRYARRRHRD